MLSHQERLTALRAELARRSLEGLIVPLADEHMSEYVGEYARRLHWLTGFRGSAGTAVVLQASAAFFCDGRYSLQVRQEVDKEYWNYQSIPQATIPRWLLEHAPEGAHIGYDPWLHTQSWLIATRAALSQRGIELVAVDSNPVDALWMDRPAPSVERVYVHPEEFAGKSAEAKCGEVAEWLRSRDADAAVLSLLDSIAWLFNIRGRDIQNTPVALAYAVVNRDATAELFVNPRKLTAEVMKHLGQSVRVHELQQFAHYLRSQRGVRIAVNPEGASAAIFACLEEAGAQILAARDPVVSLKARKNPIEISGHRAAQLRDGVALTRFLHWVSVEAPKGNVTELLAAARLYEFRKATGELRDLSFPTISAFGPNAALAHYQPTESTNKLLAAGSLYLVDSGGQYLDGTTDVTRTIAIGTPSPVMRDHFTRVLKGHIAVAGCTFPMGTQGGQLDAFARQYLWSVGLDYAHGTGHGVGSYLCVHEIPRIIQPHAPFPGGNEPLSPGMIVSIEPGYYRPDEYGIRIENLALVVTRAVAGSEHQMLGFESLTLAPIERSLIELALLTNEEIRWIDSYHGEVAAKIGPQLETTTREWLLQATRPLR